jgi:hypothetical protein
MTSTRLKNRSAPPPDKSRGSLLLDVAGVSCCQMRIVDRLPSFPAVKPKLRGLQAEAYELLKSATADRPVLKVDLAGESIATAKRAFTVAAKALKRGVQSRLADDNTLLVKVVHSPGIAVAAHRAATAVAHSAEVVEAEAKRLWSLKGERGAYERLSETVKRGLRISAKRNLSRRSR